MTQQHRITKRLLAFARETKGKNNHPRREDYQTTELIPFRAQLVNDMVRKVRELNRESFAVKQHLRYVDEAEYQQKPLGELVREIVGLDMNAAKTAFAEFLDGSGLDSRQIYFVNQIVEYIVHNGVMKDLSVLQETPFTDQGSIVEVFTDVSLWARIKSVIDRVNANAAA